MSRIGLLRQLVLAKRNVNLPREKIEKLQNKKLRRLLRHAYRNSKYYYEAFRSAGITEESIDNERFQRGRPRYRCTTVQ